MTHLSEADKSHARYLYYYEKRQPNGRKWTKLALARRFNVTRFAMYAILSKRKWS